VPGALPLFSRPLLDSDLGDEIAISPPLLFTARLRKTTLFSSSLSLLSLPTQPIHRAAMGAWRCGALLGLVLCLMAVVALLPSASATTSALCSNAPTVASFPSSYDLTLDASSPQLASVCSTYF